MEKKKHTIDFELIWKDINSNLNPTETTELTEWLDYDPAHKEFYLNAKDYFSAGKISRQSNVEVTKVLKKVSYRVFKDKSIQIPGWLKTVSAVAATVLILLTTYFILESQKKEDINNQLVADVQLPPGNSKARLVIDNGEIIELGNDILLNTEIDGTVISAKGSKLTYNAERLELSSEIRYNTLEIPRGAEYKIVLSDSTTVYLNSESSIRYPVFFTGEDRMVELTGEAYFEVTPNDQKPFKVVSGGQTVEVLGTSFNISSYEEEDLIYTTLVEGKVKVISKEETELYQTLLPGYQTYYYKDNGYISIREVDVYDYVAWKDGVFSFTNKPLSEMMNILSRWYDVSIVFKNPETAKIRFTGEVQRYDNLEIILEMIEKTFEVDFEVNENIITID